MPPDQYAQAAQEALGKLSPEERAAFLKMLQERAAARGAALPRQVASDPNDLGKMLTDLHEKPGRLREILGPGGTQPQQQAQGSNPITMRVPGAKPTRPWSPSASCGVPLSRTGGRAGLLLPPTRSPFLTPWRFRPWL